MTVKHPHFGDVFGRWKGLKQFCGAEALRVWGDVASRHRIAPKKRVSAIGKCGPTDKAGTLADCSLVPARLPAWRKVPR